MFLLRWILLFVAFHPSVATIREPWVENVFGFFDAKDCSAIIEAAEAIGFQTAADSIDYNDPKGAVSWEIDVVLERELKVPSLEALYSKYLPRLHDFVAEQKVKMTNGDTSEPILDWVFVRKYAAGEDRRMLKLHHDINLFTVNVALNDDFEGGGLFYHKNEESYFSNGDVLPNFPQEKLNYDYLEQVTRQNTSYIVFPDAKTGSLLIHNYTLYHAIAPIEKGTRYSLIFFYDMHHPDVKRFYPEPFDVVVENSFDFPIDIYYLDNQSIERTLLLLMEDVTDKRFTFEGMPGQRYEVYASSGGDVIQIFEVYNDKVEGEEYIIRLGDESQVLVIIKNDFPYPVSLHWWDDDDTDNPKVVLEEVLGRSHQMYSSVGHRFDIVQQDTGVVVDHFELDDARKGGSYFFHVGPQKKTTTTTEEKIPATIENNFPYPVSLYWIDHEEDNRPRFVLEEVLDKVHHMNTMSGHQFEVRKVDTEELVATFQVNETDSNEVIVIKIGPEPVDTVEGTTVETLPTSDLATNKDEL